MKIILFLSLSVLLVACIQEQTVDASTEETYTKSLEEIGKTLDEDKKAKFGEALQILMFAELQSHINSSEGGLLGLTNMDTDALTTDAIKKMDGKTASEIIDMAEQKKLNYKKEQLKSIREEIKELTEAKSESSKKQTVLDKITISNPKFYWSKGGYISEPVIDFTIKNETDVALATVFFHGVVASPNRTIPWISEDFNYEFKGGIEPNETKDLQLAPNSFGEWGVKETKERDDLVMTIEVLNAENAEGEKIASSFNESEKERLAILLEQEKNLSAEID